MKTTSARENLPLTNMVGPGTIGVLGTNVKHWIDRDGIVHVESHGGPHFLMSQSAYIEFQRRREHDPR